MTSITKMLSLLAAGTMAVSSAVYTAAPAATYGAMKDSLP